MAGIFINYRRDDAPGVAGRLFDHLAPKFSRRGLFMDVDAMKPGRDFVEQLDIQVSQCNVLLAIIGPHWFDATDQNGQRRLDSADDYVRIELASALKRDIPVIPVLVDGAPMPPQDGLPDDLKPLVRRHALELRHTRFSADADAIVQALEAVMPSSRNPWMRIAAGIVVAVGVAAALSWPKLSALLHPAAAPTVIIAAKPPPTAPAPAAVPPERPAPPPAGSASGAPSNTAPPPSPTAPSTTPNSALAPAPITPSNAAAPAPTVASVLGAAAGSALPPDAKLGDMMKGIVFPGSNLRITAMPDAVACQATCRAETRCVVWTYTQPAGPGLSARCALKAVIPAPAANDCCTSAVERVPPPELREPPPVPAGVSGAQPGIELQGGTYTYFGGSGATSEACQAACRADGQCLAWDYARPGIFGSDARCFLKNGPSTQVSSPCCIAGFERRTAASSPPTDAPPPQGTAAPGEAMAGTNLYGSDYRYIDFTTNDWTQCQQACRADTQCLAWTLVRPGIQGPNARCWLKNKIPRASHSACCTSGVERTAGQ